MRPTLLQEQQGQRHSLLLLLRRLQSRITDHPSPPPLVQGSALPFEDSAAALADALCRLRAIRSWVVVAVVAVVVVVVVVLLGVVEW